MSDGPVFARWKAWEVFWVAVIIDRAKRFIEEAGGELDGLSLEMDLAAVHARVPLRLRALAGAPDFDFVHDVVGIINHMDRRTGLLQDHFVPRFARHTKPN